ncbi:hypothetical protein E1091_14985 [Micromonospora fluostatini]|uniref:Uncharacterized protein n=1 Tax=Micromonospora fluostatini TaxID=1629071 RepID=A0ABY2DE89_9ACTN|nr:hypothetical protein E1091_14985 [Micromonospora fluostatini]
MLIGPRHSVRYEAVLGVMLFLTLIATGAVLTARRDQRAWWPAILLLGPVLLLSPRFGLSAVQALPAWGSRQVAIAWTLMSLVVAVASLLIAVSWQTRRARHRDSLATMTATGRTGGAGAG